MIRFLIIITIVIIFIGLNVGNNTDITFWFSENATLNDVPIYICLFVAYILGAISVIPFAVNSSITRYRKRKNNEKKAEEIKNRKIED